MRGPRHSRREEVAQIELSIFRLISRRARKNCLKNKQISVFATTREPECEGCEVCDSPLQVTGVTLLPGATARTELARDSGPVTALCNNRSGDDGDNDHDYDDR